MSEPTTHRQREQELIAHVEKLLGDDRLRIDTTEGRRPVTSLIVSVEKGDKSVDLKRTMSEVGRPDRELQSQMPIGETLEVTLYRKKFFFLKSVVGRLKVICLSPTRALLTGQEPLPLKTQELQKVLTEMGPAAGGVPSTVVITSTSGFTLEAHEVAERRADRTVVLVEPNGAGGWAVYGPVETKALVDLFDPEADEAKRARIREQIEAGKAELSGSGIPTDKLAAKTQLPLQLVETELKNYAKANPGLVAKRLDGRMVLFREGSAPLASPASGGSNMPILDRMKSLFNRKGENEKKVAFLAERRTLLRQQADRAYEELGELEKQEGKLKEEFKQTTGNLTKRRVTSQMLQLRKDIERRQQLLQVLNQQADVVSTHLHNLELVQQGQTAKLPDSEDMAADAAKAEEMLAQLQADSELASSIGGTVGMTGMSEEEKALFEELERESGATTESESEPAEPVKQSTTKVATDKARETPAVEKPKSEARRSEPELG